MRQGVRRTHHDEGRASSRIWEAMDKWILLISLAALPLAAFIGGYVSAPDGATTGAKIARGLRYGLAGLAVALVVAA